MIITATYVTGYEFGEGSAKVTETVEFSNMVDFDEWRSDKEYWGDEITNVDWKC